jgi:GrpB-like predicted nucleotidyltransferase (UPF0157 family)
VDAPDRDDLDRYLDSVLIGGREERTVEIVDYTSSWETRFAGERARIEGALGTVARRIEHIGSTAVPGLAAKPIVDIMVTVDDPDDEDAYRRPLEEAGYVLRVREPAHRMFRTPARDVHVHIWRAGSDDEHRHILFRDRLRSNADDRDEYERTKRSLVGHYRDMNHYAEAKTAVIRTILTRASDPGTGPTT